MKGSAGSGDAEREGSRAAGREATRFNTAECGPGFEPVRAVSIYRVEDEGGGSRWRGRRLRGCVRRWRKLWTWGERAARDAPPVMTNVD